MKDKVVSVTLFIVLLVGIVFCVEKSDFFVDEMASYGLANGYYNPFMRTLCDYNLTDNIVDGDAIYEYVTVDSEHRFAYDSVVYNQMQDVHPPFFYMILHTVCSFFPNGFSKWMGLIPNLIFWMVTLVFLYKITKELSNKRWGLLVVILYGLSNTSLSTLTMVRMYMLLTMLTVLLMWNFLQIMKKQTVGRYLAIYFIILIGMLTHYFFAIYAFFGCAFIVFYFLKDKKWKELLIFSASSLLGVLSMVALYPFAFTAVTSEQSLARDYTFIKCLLAWKKNCIYGGRGIFMAAACGVFAVLIILINYKNCHKIIRENKTTLQYIGWLFIPVVISILIISVIAPVYRYIYHLVPFIVIIIGLLCAWAFKNWSSRRSLVVGAILLIGSFVISQWVFDPDYLYLNQRNGNSVIQAYKDSPCIYINQKNTEGAIDSNLAQLMEMKDIYLQKDPTNSKIKDYVENHSSNQNIIVYISYCSSSCDEGILQNLTNNLGTPYTWSCEQVGEFSRMYLLQQQ